MSGELFKRAAYYLDDFVELYESCILGCGKPDDPEERRAVEAHAEMKRLSSELRFLCGEWEKRRAFGDARNASLILRDMLKDWKLPGAVWYWPATRSFRLVGDGYEPREGEVCVGVYLPTATAAMLEGDIAEVMNCTSTRTTHG